jgi:serine/threonine-protein phosphatase PGAM5
VVAHGNVIRHWVCRALEIDPEKWLRMDVIQASITTIQVNEKGELMVLGFSDCGHIPRKKRTYL